jgi:hypothetical protein
MEKIVVFAPMPIASDSAAVAAPSYESFRNTDFIGSRFTVHAGTSNPEPTIEGTNVAKHHQIRRRDRMPRGDNDMPDRMDDDMSDQGAGMPPEGGDEDAMIEGERGARRGLPAGRSASRTSVGASRVPSGGSRKRSAGSRKRSSAARKSTGGSRKRAGASQKKTSRASARSRKSASSRSRGGRSAKGSRKGSSRKRR